MAQNVTPSSRSIAIKVLRCKQQKLTWVKLNRKAFINIKLIINSLQKISIVDMGTMKSRTMSKIIQQNQFSYQCHPRGRGGAVLTWTSLTYILEILLPSAAKAPTFLRVAFPQSLVLKAWVSNSKLYNWQCCGLAPTFQVHRKLRQ